MVKIGRSALANRNRGMGIVCLLWARRRRQTDCVTRGGVIFLFMLSGKSVGEGSSTHAKAFANRPRRMTSDSNLLQSKREPCEPRRICRRPFRLSHAAMAGSSSMA